MSASPIWLVAEREIRTRARTRSFQVGTAITLAAVLAAVAIPALRQGRHATYRVGISAPSPLVRDEVVGAGRQVRANVVIVDVAPGSEAAAKAVRTKAVQVAVVGSDYVLVDKADRPGSTSRRSLFVSTLSRSLGVVSSLREVGVPDQAVPALAHPSPLPVRSLRPPPRGEARRITALYGILLTWVLLQQYGFWILLGVIEEKSTRIVEILLSTVRPVELLTGKVLGIGALALAQAAALTTVALAAAAALGSDVFIGQGLGAVGLALMWFVLGYAFYCSLYAAAGSLASRAEEAQNISFPLQLPLILSYVVSLPVITSGNLTTLARILAYLPPTAPMAMPAAASTGQIGPLGIALSAGATAVSTVLVMRLASTVYQRAILRSGRRLKLREVMAAQS